MTSFLLHHRYYQTNVTRFFDFGPLSIKIFGYASVVWLFLISIHKIKILCLSQYCSKITLHEI